MADSQVVLGGASVKAPRHVAIIMDGNSRWARRSGVAQHAGHRAGVEAIRRVLEACRDLGIEVLTVFAFSSENWLRPQAEVKGLMSLFNRYLRNEAEELGRAGVRLRFIGDRTRFSKTLQEQIERAENITRENSRFTMVIAADYGGQWDIAQATRKIAEKVKAGAIEPADVTQEMVGKHISMSDLPPPDLMIRTGGDHRISNFLLWQSAYTELYFTETYWPDFDAEALSRAVEDYSLRERRFGVRDDDQPEGQDA